MQSLINDLSIILFLTLANGLFVMSDLAVVSARKIRLQQLANQSDRNAQAALKLAEEPNNFLASVQVLITVITLNSGSFGEQALSHRFTPYFEAIPFLRPYAEVASYWGAVLIIAYLTLVLGELVPKRLALNSPERISTFVAIPMSLLGKIALPIVHLLSTSTDIVIR